MRSKGRILLMAFSAALLMTGVASDSLARSFGHRGPNREPLRNGNLGRDAGGSCVYDKQGKVVFTPAGKHCRASSDHLSTAPRSDSPIIANYPAALQSELSKLLGDHDHIAQEMTRLRQAIVSRDRELALEVVDKIRDEAAEHGLAESASSRRWLPITHRAEGHPPGARPPSQ